MQAPALLRALPLEKRSPFTGFYDLMQPFIDYPSPRRYIASIHAPADRKVRWGFSFPIATMPEMQTILLVDGENIKGKIRSVFKDASKGKPAWHEYDFRGLLDKVLEGIKRDREVFYFARIKEHEQSKEKSRRLVEDQRQLKTHLEKQGFEVILSGRVRGQFEDGQGGKKVLVFKEKGVDVKIAVDMVSLSCDKKAREIILGSSDSDLQPAIKEVRDRQVSCVYLGFEAQPNKGLTFTTNRTILIRNSELFEFEKTRLNRL